MKKYLLYILIFLSISGTAFSQNENIGIPFIRNYTNKEYNSGNQNFSIVQDNRGVMYFANSTSILEFDGISWRKIFAPGQPYIYYLAKDNYGRIYVGGDGQLGYLSSNAEGSLEFVSLLDKMPEKEREKVSKSKKISITKNNEVVFISSPAIYVYKNDTIKVIKTDSTKKSSAFTFHFKVDNRLFIQERTKGIHEFKDGKLRFLKGSEMFANKWVTGMFNGRGDTLMIVAYSPIGNKIYAYSNGKIKEVEKYQLLTHLYSYDKYGENYALGLYDKGLLLTDKNLNLKKHITKTSGLQNNQVYSVYTDIDKNIWLGLANGISVVYQNSPYSVFRDNVGLTATTNSSIIFNNKWYIGNATGVFYINSSSNIGVENQKFKAVFNPKGSTQIWKIDTVNNTLLCAGTNGFFSIKNDTIAEYIQKDESIRTFIRIKNHPNLLLTGSGKGLILFEYVNKKWQYKNDIKGYDKQCRHIEQDNDSVFWISDRSKGVFRLTLNVYLDSVKNIKEYKKEQGLPDNLANYVFKINDKVVFGTKKGVYRYDQTSDSFKKDEFFNKIFKKDLKITKLYQSKNGDIWFKEERTHLVNKSLEPYWELGRIRFIGDSAIIEKTPFNKVKNNIYSFNTISDNELIIGNEKGFVHYNLDFKKKYNKPFITLIRNVDLIENDSLIFGGCFVDSMGVASTIQNSNKLISINYKFNDLRLSYSGIFYENTEKILYKYFLEGNDKKWSDWKPETVKEYSNLDPGTYTFMVKAKNLYGTESKVAKFSFEILPPWYRTIWAYISYFLLFIFFIWAIVQLSLRRVRKQKENLEQIVEKRTAQIQMQNEELNAQKDEIEEQNKQLSGKNEEISHKNKEITASINYAKRIQEAMLPLKSNIKSALEDSFILFKPRDIVSGDFYWFAETNGKIIITAVDCTGHGVPGAFMSMIGSEILTTIVNKGITKADAILEDMNKYVVQALKQETSENQDGMDLALCVIDKKNKTVEYAGAKNPLVYIMNDELKQIKGSRKAIGGVQREADHFESHLIHYESPAYFYIFSDGFQDQFGGPKMRKFMIKRMKAMFVENYNKPMDEQHEIMSDAIEDWMKDVDQTDDILMIGFKL